MQSSKEQKGEIRKPSSAINVKKQRKTTEWDRLKRNTRDLFKKIRDTKGTFHAKIAPQRHKWHGPIRSRRY